MKKVILSLLCFLTVLSAQAQNSYNESLIDLARVYKNGMFGTAEPTKKTIKQLKEKNTSDSLQNTIPFILECVTVKSKILNKSFLTLPDDKTLQSVYIIREVSQNMREEDGPTNEKLVDSLLKSTIQRELLVDQYYNTLFTANGNKNQPFNLSKYDFNLDEYNLANDTEKGIFFLRCMSICGSTIWGFMNIPKPANTGKAMDFINKFPKINGQDYYRYTDLYFEDFQIVYNDSLQSYKGVFIDKYYDLMLNHLICMDK
ncbi:MAG: hypothetical protein GQ574_23655 [Crocinitomix sp.]|nr:hypothetical protein [Crocinitomix sp.]